jgi:TolA-binding protein
MERLRSLLLAPAFATAAVAALVFVISFFLVERATPGGDSPAAVEKVPFFGPAVPFEERAVATEAEALEIPEAPGESEPVLAALPESEIAKSRESGAAPRTRRSSERRGRGPTDLSTRLRGKGGAIDYLLGDSPPKKSVGKRKKEVTTTAKPSTVLNRENGADPFPSADDESSGESPESKSRKIGASAELAEDADFQQGLDAYDKGDCDAANTALLRTVKSRFAVPTQKAIALHHLARCEKRSGRFGKALPWYDQLLSGYPTYSRRPEALWEAVVCHRRLGHLDRAGALLNELQRFPSWKDRASQEILRLGLEPQ